MRSGERVPRITRRDLLAAGAAVGAGGVLPLPVAAAPVAAVSARWIDGISPPLQTGQTFGTAWPRGAVRAGAPLRLADGGGRGVAGQSWTLATWPDGSLKWSAHAVPGDIAVDALSIAPGRPVAPAEPIRVRDTADAIEVRSGDLRWVFGRGGAAVLRGAWVGARAVTGAVTLVGSRRDGPDGTTATPFVGMIERVTVEQRGPVRAVLRFDGRHVGQSGRAWLPFTLRCYVYAGSRALRIVHSFVYDGDPAREAIASMGVRAEVPMRGAPYDRHVRLAHDRQTFAEAALPLTGLRRDPGAAFRSAQAAGRAVPPVAEMDAAVRDRLDAIPQWSDFTLEQANANGFTIAKRTGAGHAWVAADAGARAPGLAYAGGPEGGAALGLRWFWQRHPSALDVEELTQDTARITAWLWSPRAPAMDLRPYRGTMGMEGYAAQNAGLAVTYEDYEPGFDTPTGIARTSELTLWALPATPDAATFARMAAITETPPQLMASPESLHRAGVFGDWSLPARTSPNRRAIEDQLERLTDFYAGEVDRRSWYGFWDHGDVMHSYDADRHRWRYDIGGFAWANSELSPDLWLWYQTLRTGDARTFRLAEAMTRHTGEVDVYHLGRFAGLGTRHGVQHWADSSKQPRVSNAAYRRIFYYLTADERTGDLMRALVTSDAALRTVDIGRKTEAVRDTPPAGTIDLSFGTSWCAIAAAWLTEWERTGDARWRDRIVAGMDSIGRLPNGWLEGSGWYDLASGRFLPQGKGIRISHLNGAFGAVEINAELLQLLDVPRYRATWLDYCRWYNAPREAFVARFGGRYGGRNLRGSYARMTAYVAQAERDPALAARAATEFFEGEAALPTWPGDPRRTVDGVVEWPGISTNAAAQWALAAIQTTALVPDAIDRATIPPPRQRGSAE